MVTVIRSQLRAPLGADPISRAPNAVVGAIALTRSVLGSQVDDVPAQTPSTQRTGQSRTSRVKSPGSGNGATPAIPRCTVPGSGADASTPTCQVTGFPVVIEDNRTGSLTEVRVRYVPWMTVSTSAA